MLMHSPVFPFMQGTKYILQVSKLFECCWRYMLLEVHAVGSLNAVGGTCCWIYINLARAFNYFPSPCAPAQEIRHTQMAHSVSYKGRRAFAAPFNSTALPYLLLSLQICLHCKSYTSSPYLLTVCLKPKNPHSAHLRTSESVSVDCLPPLPRPLPVAVVFISLGAAGGLAAAPRRPPPRAPLTTS